jgi:hypothetical protein
VLKDALGSMKSVRGNVAVESKRWQVLYDFVLLRLQARLVHLAEYNYLLGQFRTDKVPALEPGDIRWRLSPSDRVGLTIPEAYYKGLVKEIKRGWEVLAKNYPGTPWAYQAERESRVILGLTWQTSKE